MSLRGGGGGEVSCERFFMEVRKREQQKLIMRKERDRKGGNKKCWNSPKRRKIEGPQLISDCSGANDHRLQFGAGKEKGKKSKCGGLGRFADPKN